MSLVLTILLVLGLFTLVGIVAWAAVAQISADLQGTASRPSVLESPLADSRELVGQRAG
jgi:hypothetical protein